MNFEQIWQQYDFTEAELLNMGWQLPGDYVLHLNYYWDEWGQVSDRDRPLTVILLDCTRLTVQLHPTRPKSGYPSHLGTIVGWGLVSPSEWLLRQQLSEDLWLHLRFEIGSNSFALLKPSVVLWQFTSRNLPFQLAVLNSLRSYSCLLSY